MIKRALFAVAMLSMLSSVAMADFTSNGDFETGDTSDWESFPTATSTFDVTMDANSGTWAGTVENTDLASSHVIKQANVGVGTVQAGEDIIIKFSAKGVGAVGGVVFAEFFSELSGGGTSAGEILGGAPLALTNDYQDFEFTATTGPDVSGGITLQFAVVTGGATGSTSTFFVDDVSLTRAIPEPASLGVLALAGIGMVFRRRR